MDVKNTILEQERIYEDFLIRIYNKSLDGLTEILNEISRFRRYAWFYSDLHQINSLKLNINSIQEKYDFDIETIVNKIKQQREITKDTFKQYEKEEYLNKFLIEIDNFINKISDKLFLLSIFLSIGLYNSIDTIIALFTGSGVLGIDPIQRGLIINNTASEIMFKDKLEDLDQKFTFIINYIRTNKKQELDHLNLYFNIFKKNLSH
ncbi:unnamed protein product [Adineta steineri]|uniref:Uncharacterized protein n=1 Tax=Adineta steineri TaxID=433720 RepID=A0A813X8N7_9BILA|nr:unnamed protein product [Adineta steineri]CAF3916106.1 unnamed protein product [Adineta steineri]